ncbi:MAG: preprotein translocase subunit SecA [Candidatus Nomurabacteria bacterium]|nr:MAG: preprotein translocase subunit SecA [Candidatus Nomurabacteria bacterium]
MMSVLTKLFGDANARTVKSLQKTVDEISALEAKIQGMDDAAILQRVQEIQSELREQETPTAEKFLVEVFAIVRETAKRKLGMRHFDVQLIGGMVLHKGMIAEMKTGEGKTLVATLPVTLNALSGKGVHVVTVNDYLAKRDAQWMGPVYHALGLSVASIQHEAAFLYDPEFQSDDPQWNNLRPVQRKDAYAADITYGTNNEFGFDYLRDNMVPDASLKVQRALHYAIVDEVDSILIDEARTPLIISAPAEDSGEENYRYADLVQRLSEGADYNVDEKMRSATLTEGGIAKIEQALHIENMYEAGGIETVHRVEQALKAHALFQRDKDYVVKDGEVVIVDEFTGRLMFGRRYSEGLHQAIEAKERVEIKKESETLATISFQNLFRLYDKLSGMTGTAMTEAEEFSKIYELEVVTIPTNKPLARVDLPDSIYKNEKGKFLSVVREVKRRHELGQPVLLGTISIEKNEILGELLKREGIPHEVLNAKNHEKEAAILAQAGRKGAVTVATNMAGRGVDIILGGAPYQEQEAEFVRSVGGLHVIGTERHESRRIDNQLRGRAGRQGDPGSTQFFVCMDDDLMRIFGSDRMKSIMERLGLPEDMPIENKLISRSIEQAQKKVEGHNFDIRKHLVEYDDVMNKHREVIYRKRNEYLSAEPEKLREIVLKSIEEEITKAVSFHTASEDEHAWDIEEIYEIVDSMFPIAIEKRIKLDELRAQAGDTAADAAARQAIIHYLVDLAQTEYARIEEHISVERMRQVERGVALRSIDTLWIEHLDNMTRLRQGIGLRGYGQRDPLVEYKKEAYGMFTQLIDSVNNSIVFTLFRMSQTQNIAQATPMQRRVLTMTAPAKVQQDAKSAFSPSDPNTPAAKAPSAQETTNALPKVGRNDLCPCGSGKKYKKCHGA